MTWTVRVGVTLVRAYQLLLSPFSGGACRFHPTCSVYATEAITTHGLARGSWLAVKRVSRCHPFARPGWDPVPPRVG
jgi:putative membrane protein insertion efficiency factor